jgi:hypothetical protein
MSCGRSCGVLTGPDGFAGCVAVPQGRRFSHQPWLGHICRTQMADKRSLLRRQFMTLLSFSGVYRRTFMYYVKCRSVCGVQIFRVDPSLASLRFRSECGRILAQRHAAARFRSTSEQRWQSKMDGLAVVSATAARCGPRAFPRFQSAADHADSAAPRLKPCARTEDAAGRLCGTTWCRPPRHGQYVPEITPTGEIGSFELWQRRLSIKG